MAEIKNTDIVLKWYVVRAISGKERKIRDYIESEINTEKLQDFVKQILIPTEKVYQIRKGKKVSKERSFFPGYILVEAALVGSHDHTLGQYYQATNHQFDQQSQLDS